MLLGPIQRGADHSDLAVHHPAGGDHVDAGIGMREGHLGVHLEGAVVVDPAVRGQHAAVPVVGELVEAEVAHHRERVTDLGHDVVDREVEDARRVHGAGAGRVLLGGDPEEHHATEPQLGGLGDRLQQGRGRVLHDARHRADRLRGVDPLTYEQRQHQLAWLHRCLGDHPAQGRRGPQAARSDERAGDRGDYWFVRHRCSSRRGCAGPLSHRVSRLRRQGAFAPQPPRFVRLSLASLTRLTSLGPSCGRRACAPTAG